MTGPKGEAAEVVRTATVLDPIGLHARPAVKLTMLAKEYRSQIELRAGARGRWVNAKSPKEVMKLKAGRGETLLVRARGDDAESAIAALTFLLQNAPPSEAGRREEVVFGKPAAPGLVVGEIALDRAPAEMAEVEGAHDRAALEAALERSRSELRAMIDGGSALAAEILKFQLALLDDSGFVEPILGRATQTARSAVAVWNEALDREIADYVGSGSEHRAARADDLRDLQQRVLRAVSGRAEHPGQAFPPGAILVATQLTPSRFLQLDWSTLGGAALRGGSPTSHVSILARAQGVPLIVGVDRPVQRVPDGAPAILDAEEGQLIVHPSQASVARARGRRAQRAVRSAEAIGHLHKDAVTADGKRVLVLLNVDDPAVVDRVRAEHCDGIGLMRTELFFRGEAPPSEDAQLAAYRRMVQWASGRPVTVRTLDAGGDKPLPGGGHDRSLLGLRGVRQSLGDPDRFVVQLRALARAAAEGPLRILIPMVTVPRELMQVRALLGEAIAQLQAEGLEHGTPAVGMMVEVPAAALTAHAFDADFYAIGTNDLVQYTTASSREDPQVAHLAEADNPAVIELIRRVVDAAAARGVEVSLCGSMASDPRMVSLLLDCGLRALSVEPGQLGPVKRMVSRCTLSGDRL